MHCELKKSKGDDDMKKILLLMLLVMVIFTFTSSCSDKVIENNTVSLRDNLSQYDITMRRDLLCVMMAYPEYVKGVERGSEDSVYLVMKSGNKLLYDDKRTKTLDGKMNNSDIQDMMEQLYPILDIKNLSEKDFDPGRVRVYGILKEVYGVNREKIQKNLVNAKTPFKNLQFNGNNGAAQSLENAMKELYTIAKGNSRVAGAISPISGTFNYRVISGTSLLSAHSFGIAIDLASDKRDYWKWATREQGQKRLDFYPREVVKVFENNGFVWGGKWGHFDILHFEYRPEIIYKARYFESREGTEWYEGVPMNDRVKGFVEMIDEGLN